jgi:hypothetical protein
VESAFVLVPANATAVGIIKCFDAQFDFIITHGAAIAAFDSWRI